ncbi:hypothetical protein ACFE04_008752 [Oxalis oulophora]
MGSLNLENQDGIIRTVAESPPSHYTVKIQSLSLLTKNNADKYETADFEAGGYKWKLIVHPNGNKNKSVSDHISVYLAMADTTLLTSGSEVYATFRLFLLDQNNDNYLIVQDSSAKERRFHRLKHEWGLDKFISHKIFNDATNGYLVDDTCVLGAEVYVTKERSKGKGECLSMIKDPITSKHVWKFESLSKLDSESSESKTFIAGEQKWKMIFHPKGKRNGTGSHISLYLALADPTSLPSGSKIFAEFTLRILDQLQAKHVAGKGTYWFSASTPETGWARYNPFTYFYQPGNGLLVKDNCLVEAEGHHQRPMIYSHPNAGT